MHEPISRSRLSEKIICIVLSLQLCSCLGIDAFGIDAFGGCLSTMSLIQPIIQGKSSTALLLEVCIAWIIISGTLRRVGRMSTQYTLVQKGENLDVLPATLHPPEVSHLPPSRICRKLHSRPQSITARNFTAFRISRNVTSQPTSARNFTTAHSPHLPETSRLHTTRICQKLHDCPQPHVPETSRLSATACAIIFTTARNPHLLEISRICYDIKTSPFQDTERNVTVRYLQVSDYCRESRVNNSRKHQRYQRLFRTTWLQSQNFE
jgi:hypothetical protein